MSTHLLALILGVLGAVIGSLVAVYAARRTARQPVSIEIGAERRTLASVLQDPGSYVFVAELTPQSFVEPAHSRIWAAIEELNKDVDVPAPESKQAAFEAASAEVPSDLLPKLADAALNASDAALIAELSEIKAASSRAELLEEGSKVYNAASDRGRFSGAAPLTPGGPGEKLLVRRYQRPTVGRKIFASVTLAAVGGLTPWLTSSYINAPSSGWILASLSLFTLAVFSLVWALVDHDTMYLDYPSFLIGGSLSWLLAAASAWALGDWGRLLIGALLVVIVAIFFEGGSFLFKIIRGEHGMGFGDTVIAVATIGVPVAISGEWILGLYTLLASGACAIIGWVVLKFTRGNTADTPFAFGPYLALGWIAAFTFVTLVGVDTLVGI